MTFQQKLDAAWKKSRSLVCVGLDPEFGKHRVEEVAGYNRQIIEATAPYAACYKPNIAFYEQWGVAGLRALEDTLAFIPRDIPVIGDVKRGDIGSTAAAYARAMFEQWGFDDMRRYLYENTRIGSSNLQYEGKGFYFVCRTSNPGAADFQYLEAGEDVRLYERVALTVTEWSPLAGLVVGATAPDELRRVRALVPNASLLVPGVGAQGGSAREVAEAAGLEPGTIVVSASRSIMYASSGHDFAEAAAAAARALRDELSGAAART